MNAACKPNNSLTKKSPLPFTALGTNRPKILQYHDMAFVRFSDEHHYSIYLRGNFDQNLLWSPKKSAPRHRRC